GGGRGAVWSAREAAPGRHDDGDDGRGRARHEGRGRAGGPLRWGGSGGTGESPQLDERARIHSGASVGGLGGPENPPSLMSERGFIPARAWGVWGARRIRPAGCASADRFQRE